MYAKIFILILSILFLTSNFAYSANLGRMPTQEELDKWCVPLLMTTDNQVHWFFYKHIEFDTGGVTISFGKKLEKKSYYLKEQILNFDDAMFKWFKIKEANR